MLFLDTETTGLEPGTDEILSLALVNDAGQVLLSTHVRPLRMTQWPEAMAVNGITPEFIFSGNFPTMAELVPQIIQLIRADDLYLCAYNWAFDKSMLGASSPALRRFILDETGERCCMERYAIYHGVRSSKSYHRTGYRPVKLTRAAELTGYQWTDRAHGALADALACRHVWQYLDAIDFKP